MKIFRLVGIIALAVLLSACKQNLKEASYQVVPLPQEILPQDGANFIMSRKTVVVFPADNEKMKRNAEFLVEYLAQSVDYKLKTSNTETSNNIVLKLGLENENPEAYQLTVNSNQITIQGASEVGVFYGIQTLRKSLPAVAPKAKICFNPVIINDLPRFKYRGFHLDVARHFASTDFLKRTIDALALHNLNHFHLHLTDDQGWRMEIKKYPKLTEVGAWRESTCIKGKPENQDSIPHGGFYTQDELRELVSYAAERNVIIVPEIDLPGHMLAALAAYPEYGCAGGPYKVWGQWGVSDEVLCVGKESTMTFLEDILTEVIEVFPSQYIHIGGDECPKKSWKNCDTCQAKIKELGIKSDKNHTAEEYLQSYVMTRMENFIKSKGRRIIGWDEILEGGLGPDAIVMSWRGMNGGTEAALQDHEVIMTPNTHVYFDYYQTRDTENEQFAIGGFNSVERVYSLEPVPSILEKDKHHLIIGAQANLWCEYLASDSAREYMIYPRIAALSEVDWTYPEKKNYNCFIKRMGKMFDIYQREGYNYAKHLLEVSMIISPNIEKETVEFDLSTLGDASIYYTLDGSEPTEKSNLYTEPLQINSTCEVKTVAVRPEFTSKVKSQKVNFNKATLKPIEFSKAVHNNYAYIQPETLIDGMVGDPIFNTGAWIGYLGTDMQAVIDLKEPQEISSVEMTLLIEPGNYIFGAEAMKVEVSEDGKNFKTVKYEKYTDVDKWENVAKDIETVVMNFDTLKTRFVRITGESVKCMPKWHGATGEPAWIFVGEIGIK